MVVLDEALHLEDSRTIRMGFFLETETLAIIVNVPFGSMIFHANEH